jgi:hypothetical protein
LLLTKPWQADIHLLLISDLLFCYCSPLQKQEMPTVLVAQLMMLLPQRCPHLTVEALDAEEFFGVTLETLDALK